MHEINKIGIKRLLKDVNKLKMTDEDRWNFKSYIEFLRYFRHLKVIRLNHFLIGSHFAYGWMPTMLRLFPKTKANNKSIHNPRTVLKILNKVKRNNTINTNEMDILKTSINNSLVGTSKLLHFINPKNYPIWDARVVKYLNLKNHNVRNVEYYECFRKRCNEIGKEGKFLKFHRKVESLVKNKVTAYRAIEFVMWKSARK